MGDVTKRPNLNRNANLTSKKRFDLRNFWQELQQLDRQNYGSWPLVIKVLLILVLLLAVIIVGYAVPIRHKLADIQAAEAQQEVLLQTYQSQKAQSGQLQPYKAQMIQLESQFAKLLEQIPATATNLVDSINSIGVDSGIRFQDIAIDTAIEQPLFIEQPIRIIAVGQYHQLGLFMSRLGELPRLITLHDFEVTNLVPSLQKTPELTLTLQAKAYRVKPIAPEIAVANSEPNYPDATLVND